ncbi:MAG: BCD family MFS transporter [Aestuariivita sp.]|nr:BCD family MFS transporter [Aestuariivita sp.]MCY4203845.1 BCD family MFS transporter [Aestuariivita sp.]MCY4288388.1 BCD family MFS transporter [Aestuariivita sp.]MCY4345702.1 BCD family MFS transporter [Aestuariivita sp.]
MRTLTWLDIVRLGCVQMCLGSIVVLTTSTLNRLMVVELALPAALPGFLVALHYGIQVTRPNWGFRSDTRGNRTAFIIGGMVALALGALVATAALGLFESSLGLGLTISIVAYSLIGLGVGASGTSLLALLATATEPARRAAAATITWLMMIAGIAITAILVGWMLEPYSHGLLVSIVAVVTLAASALTIVAVWGIERRVDILSHSESTPFWHGFREIWSERQARNFTAFVFLSMTAYFMQELILEPYSGLVFGFSPGQSTSLAGAQNGGVFFGMVLVGVAATGLRLGSLRSWVIAGCIGSALMLTIISVLGQLGPDMPLVAAVVGLGAFNGMFAVAAIGSMMALAGDGRKAREGTRMGLWGAAQAIAAGFGGLAGAASVDLFRPLLGSDADAFGTVFLIEAGLFVLSAVLAYHIMGRELTRRPDLVPGE